MTSHGTCRLVMPLSELTIASAGAVLIGGLDVGFDLRLLVGGEFVEFRDEVAEAVFEIDAEFLEGGGVFGDEVLEEDLARRGRR